MLKGDWDYQNARGLEKPNLIALLTKVVACIKDENNRPKANNKKNVSMEYGGWRSTNSDGPSISFASHGLAVCCRRDTRSCTHTSAAYASTKATYAKGVSKGLASK
jgi:hypothetical protein